LRRPEGWDWDGRKSRQNPTVRVGRKRREISAIGLRGFAEHGLKGPR
jgi:hypothetical protein